MKRNHLLRRFTSLLALVLAAAACCSAKADSPQQDLAAVRKYLATQYPGKNWEQGPARLQNGAIDKAYTQRRFYYVFSSQQPAPRVDWISMLMCVEPDGGVREVSGAGAMNDGLMPVGSSGQAQVAAAAIMSLSFGPFGPVLVSPSQVPVARLNGGWYCLATPGPMGRKSQALEVIFDAGGRCTSVANRYTGPR
jgi:outer membrane protein assembly factor BamE (lipoprotein component of BamABCDE complex)